MITEKSETTTTQNKQEQMSAKIKSRMCNEP